MGFLSGITKTLFGGSDSSSNSNSSSQSGWNLLPPEIQNTFKNFSNQVNAQIPNATSAYTPIPQTADETAAIGQLRQGYAPTADSLNADVGMLMNPFNNYVINNVNREAGGNYSILKQALNEAGQFGSNRQALGANDIEQTRLNTIGNLQAQNYDQAINKVFSNLIPLRQQDTQNLFDIGSFQRSLAQATNAAPITGLQEIAKALGILPTSGGSTSTGTSTSSGSQSNGIFKQLEL